MSDNTTADRPRDNTTADHPRHDEGVKPEIVVIVAVAANEVIGDDGEMPWHYPEDLRHFRETTTGHPVILGRRTYEAITARLDGPLPDRTNVVLSRRDPADILRDSAAETASVSSGADETAPPSSSADETAPPSLNHDEASAEVRVASSVDEAVSVGVAATETSPDRSEPIFVAGGATVYEQFLPLADRLVRTELHESYEGDTRFPEWDRSAWQECDREEREQFDFVTYARVEGSTQ